MAAVLNATQARREFNDPKQEVKATWLTAEDYGLFTRYMEKRAPEFLRQFHIGPGVRVLDVGCGAGQLALQAARAGAEVTGCDISTDRIEEARRRAAEEGLTVRFEQADPQSLPYGDREFDIVVSL